MNWIQKSIANWVGLDRFVNPLYFEYYSSQFVDPIADYNDFSEDLTKIKAIFMNPAALRVFALQCNLFSLGKIYVYQNGKALDSDPFLDRIRKPNYFQQEAQFKWDYMFWKMLGNAYCYIDSNIVTNDRNVIQFLDSSKLDFPVEMRTMGDKVVLSSATANKINTFNIKYRYENGETFQFRWEKVIHVPDLTNGIGNWFKGRSKIDALYKIIANNEASIDSKNINVRYAGKFIVAGKADPENVTQIPMSGTEKNDVETKIDSRHKKIHAMKSMVDIKRFVEHAAIVGELDESYMSDYFKIGSLYDIPKDVLEASLNGTTYENQEKSIGRHISYSLQPAAEQLCGAFAERFGYTDKSIVMDWEHLPFMQVFAKERAETDKIKAETLITLMKAGVKIEEINSILDMNLTELDYERAERSGQNQNSGATPTGNT